MNGTLGRYGLELRRKHDIEAVLGAANFATVIDGGANVGDYAAKVRARLPDAQIHCFEPTPRLFQDISRRFADDNKITCHEQALSDSDGKVAFRITEDQYSSSLLEQTDRLATVPEQVVAVQSTALDTWAANRTIRRPALLKLDVEGNELAALRGAQKLLEQIDYVELETIFAELRKGQPEFRDILNFLHDRGFVLVDIYPGVLDPATGFSVWADAVFARRMSLD